MKIKYFLKIWLYVYPVVLVINSFLGLVFKNSFQDFIISFVLASALYWFGGVLIFRFYFKGR